MTLVWSLQSNIEDCKLARILLFYINLALDYVTNRKMKTFSLKSYAIRKHISVYFYSGGCNRNPIFSKEIYTSCYYLYKISS